MFEERRFAAVPLVTWPTSTAMIVPPVRSDAFHDLELDIQGAHEPIEVGADDDLRAARFPSEFDSTPKTVAALEGCPAGNVQLADDIDDPDPFALAVVADALSWLRG
jgi:hypothetical protein